jgi:hypothetical protein
MIKTFFVGDIINNNYSMSSSIITTSDGTKSLFLDYLRKGDFIFNRLKMKEIEKKATLPCSIPLMKRINNYKRGCKKKMYQKIKKDGI